MSYVLFLLLSLCQVLFLENPVYAQDQRFIQKILSGELIEDKKAEIVAPYYVIKGSTYKLDLNGDGEEENIQKLIIDGIDYLEITNLSGNTLAKYRLSPKGVESNLYRIKVSKISAKESVLVFYFYEGKTDSARFEATAKIYLASFETKDLKFYPIIEADSFFHEREAIRGQYYNRTLAVNVVDSNDDGKRDVVISFGHIQYIYIFKGSGLWQKF
jgi:hypothetical protein